MELKHTEGRTSCTWAHAHFHLVARQGVWEGRVKQSCQGVVQVHCSTDQKLQTSPCYNACRNSANWGACKHWFLPNLYKVRNQCMFSTLPAQSCLESCSKHFKFSWFCTRSRWTLHWKCSYHLSAFHFSCHRFKKIPFYFPLRNQLLGESSQNSFCPSEVLLHSVNLYYHNVFVESWECTREYKFNSQLAGISLKVWFANYFSNTFIIC